MAPPDRGARLRGPARRRDRWRQLGGPGGRLLQRIRRPCDDAGARRLTDEIDVALSDRADRGAAERRGAYRRAGRRRRGRGWPPPRAADPVCGRDARRSRKPTRASCSSAPRRGPTGSRASSRAMSEVSSSPAPMCATTAWPLSREPYVLETSVPGVFVAGDVRMRSIKRVASAVGEGSMAVSLIHEYLASA